MMENILLLKIYTQVKHIYIYIDKNVTEYIFPFEICKVMQREAGLNINKIKVFSSVKMNISGSVTFEPFYNAKFDIVNMHAE